MFRYLRAIALVVVLVLAASGCLFQQKAVRWSQAPSTVEPWWCTAGSGPDLNPADCRSLSRQLDSARLAATGKPKAADAAAAGATAGGYQAGVGARFVLRAPTASFGS